MKISTPFRPAARAILALAVVTAFAACGDDDGGTGPNVGSITVSVTSSGVGVDSAGYVIVVDNGDGEDVAPNGDLSISAAAGSHSVELAGVGSNCTIDGENPRTVDVVAGEDVAVTFQVTCTAPTLAFASLRSGSFAIYTMGSDGSGIQRLTNDASPGFATLPAWSPDGSKIAFASTRDRSTKGLDIWVMDASGANPTRLTNEAGQNGRAAWSHDGTKIAFTSTRNDTLVAEIWLMDADGGNQRAITSDGKFANTPSWSPDDSKIVFQSNRDGSDQLYVMNSDGSGITRLTNGVWADQEPAWSPDGSLIAFQSTRDAAEPLKMNNADFEVYVVNADGSSPTRLTNNSDFDGRPSWSASGGQLIFDSGRDGNQEVYVMNRDGSGQVNVTNNSADDGFARFRP